MVLLGPINLIFDVAPGNRVAGAVQLLICIVCFIAPLIRRNGWTITAAVLAAGWWIFIGVVTEGINV